MVALPSEAGADQLRLTRPLPATPTSLDGAVASAGATVMILMSSLAAAFCRLIVTVLESRESVTESGWTASLKSKFRPALAGYFVLGAPR